MPGGVDYRLDQEADVAVIDALGEASTKGHAQGTWPLVSTAVTFAVSAAGGTFASARRCLCRVPNGRCAVWFAVTSPALPSAGVGRTGARVGLARLNDAEGVSGG